MRVEGGAYLVAPPYEALGQLVDVVLYSPHIREEEIGHHAKKGRVERSQIGRYVLTRM